MAKAVKEGEQIKYTVLKPFRDKDNWDKLYQEGDDVSHFDKERIDNAIKSGLIKKPETDK